MQKKKISFSKSKSVWAAVFEHVPDGLIIITNKLKIKNHEIS